MERVIITGAATEFCVDTTLRSCVSKEFNVTMISDAHTTGDRGHLNAQAIVDHHNWVWENLLIPGIQLNVMPTQQFFDQSK